MFFFLDLVLTCIRGLCGHPMAHRRVWDDQFDRLTKQMYRTTDEVWMRLSP